ncbi:MAG: valine--tRNA ligase [Spirochaetaceae bacterium]|nr:valine--tRNA ligase [Spirochaetaceae bacterium]
MKAVELDKTYNPKDFEDRLYKFWEEKGYFKPAGDDDKDPFTIVIPPPNVTGVLHMGHGLNNSLQDILTRYNRMLGKPTLWVPGTDHAGIATQNVVERQLKAKGLGRHDLGREKFLEETWKVKDNHHSIITDQLKKIGASCDWSRERFTLDDGLSKAVKKVFVDLYNKDLIYRGEYLVNWCPSCGTALADDEVDHEEKNGKLYHYRYPLTDGSGFIGIATTRPETMFGDTAVAVHPDDDRYKHLHGKTVDLPLTGRKIPIIVDSYCKMEFGTGAVKITPAHDPNDWDIGNRHDLERINILNPDATLNDNVPEQFRGMDVKTARKATIAALKDAGVYKDDEEQPHQVGHCYRCKTVVEPYMSEQWFVKMAPLAEKALKAWEDGEIHFYPKKWENTYKHWLTGIRDWCISRQLWWGHRIPVWYCNDCGEMIVSEDDVTSCSKCNSNNLKQETDVLDTWFSSWLWPFSTLGWPENTADLEKFFPTSALVTAYDIIFFWVARMIMAGLEFTGKVPFRDIYIHQLIRAKDGRKMSKSLGNGIDPLDVVDEYGSDAMKFTLAYLSAQGQDILMDMETVKIGSKFCNKVWNASRYILMNLEGRTMLDKDTIEKKAIDQWILHRLNETVKTVATAMDAYRFDDMGHAVYEYFWNDFCDWYVEASKLYLYDKDEKEKDRAVTMLIAVLEESLKLLHPFIPFVTEEIYQKLPGAGEAIIVERYPEVTSDRENKQMEASFEILKDIVQSVRTVRSEFTIPPVKKIRVNVKVDEEQRLFMEEQKDVIAMLIKSDDFEILSGEEIPEGAVATVGKGYEALVFIRDVIDVEKEIAKLKKNIGKAEKNKIGTEKKLSNEHFVSRAPEEVIAKEKEKLEEFSTAIEKMKGHLADLEG